MWQAIRFLKTSNPGGIRVSFNATPRATILRSEIFSKWEGCVTKSKRSILTDSIVRIMKPVTILRELLSELVLGFKMMKGTMQDQVLSSLMKQGSLIWELNDKTHHL